AQYIIGLMYENAEGAAQDYVTAQMWFNLATANGFAEAAKRTDYAATNRDLVAKKLSSKQLTEAQKLARECVAKKYKGCGS
ncbi:MAG: hypothetical protein P8Q17_03665, partial [Methylophilaceae bacterium]|nr:hypothetical protein [Methylophilaceae bacterium]